MFSFKIQKYALFCLCDIEGSEAFYFAFCLFWDKLLEMVFHKKKRRTHVHIVYIQCAQFGKLVDAAVPVRIKELCTRRAFFVVPL